MSSMWRSVLASAVFILLLWANVVRADCIWLFSVNEGETNYNKLSSNFDKNKCANGIISYRVKEANGYDVSFPSAHSPILKSTFSNLGSGVYPHVTVEIMCNGFTSLCNNVGYVSFVVARSTTTTSTTTSTTTTTSTSTTTSTTPAPGSTTTSTSTTTTTAAPSNPVCTNPDYVEAPVGVAKRINILDNVQNCPNPSVSVVGESNSLGDSSIKYFSVDSNVIVFDANGQNTKEGIFTAVMRIVCGNGRPCMITQNVETVANLTTTTTTAPVLSACNRPYAYETSVSAYLRNSTTVHDEDKALCSSIANPVFLFYNVTKPTQNPSYFSMTPTGNLTYLAPANPTTDSFTFVLGCAASSSATPTNLCQATGKVVILATPTSPPSPTTCAGNFNFTYDIDSNGDGDDNTTTFNVYDRAQAGSACPSGSYTGAALVSKPTSGSVTLDASTGNVVYTPYGTGADSFQFSVTCGAKTCTATAGLSYVSTPVDNSVYHLHNDTIICRGTCDAKAWKSSPAYPSAAYFDSTASPLGGTSHVTPRKDGRDTDDISFDFTESGDLLIRAYTSIGNMAARFVTFYPIKSSEELLVSSVLDGSHVSFEPSCLERQATTGSAYDIWQWSDLANLKGKINRNKNQYVSGDNYYQTFGGKHRSCDIFREDPCKYAPLLTPTLTNDNNNVFDNTTASIKWKLYINDCDATWVGTASVESLRSLRQPDGSPTFMLVNGTQLQGTVYSEVVKPASWTDPSAGVVTLMKEYNLNLTIKDTLVVDVDVTTPGSGSDNMLGSSDIQFAVAEDSYTHERLYAYSLLIYLYKEVNNTFVAVDTSKVNISAVTLLNFTFRSPSKVECPECTGTMFTCSGVGDGYITNCGDAGIVKFENMDVSIMVFDKDPSSLGGSNLFPSTNLHNVAYLNHKFMVRVLGTHSAASAGNSPVAEFSMKLTLTDGKTIIATVHQENYISAINTNYLHTEVCRASAYWPVADALGTSLPINPYTGSANVDLGATNTTAVYGMPELLDSSCASATNALPRVHITNLTANTTSGATNMCAVQDERTYGVSDWVMLSFPSIQDEVKLINSKEETDIMKDNALGNSAYTVPTLQYLLLSVASTEAVAFLSSLPESVYPDDAEDQINILLDGSNPPTATVSEEALWMSADPSSVTENETVTYYPWAEYASALNYRRIVYDHTDAKGNNVSEPFVFAFIPGALLHSSSSVRVLFSVEASVKFTTYSTSQETKEPVVVSTREEKMYYAIPVSRATSSVIRLDADAYTTNLTVKSTNGIGKTTATWLFIVFAVCIVIVLAGSVYVEVTYKRMIHNAKYHPKRPDSAVGIRYRNGQPIDGPATENNEATPKSKGTPSPRGGSPSASAAASTSKKDKGLETKFGVIGVEQTRVVDTGDETPRSKQEAAPAQKTKPAAEDDVRSEIREEQTRVSVDQNETADL